MLQETSSLQQPSELTCSVQTPLASRQVPVSQVEELLHSVVLQPFPSTLPTRTLGLHCSSSRMPLQPLHPSSTPSTSAALQPQHSKATQPVPQPSKASSMFSEQTQPPLFPEDWLPHTSTSREHPPLQLLQPA